ncbi:MAG: hypothetical protein V4651_06100 [Bacteroidota bacterium]
MVVKKSFLILMILCYLTPAIGVTVNIHFCGSKLSSFSFNFQQQEHSCECGQRKMKSDCCQDKTASIKSVTDQDIDSFTSHSIGNKILSVKQLFFVQRQYDPIVHRESKHIRFAHPPPFQKGISLHLLNRVLLI